MITGATGNTESEPTFTSPRQTEGAASGASPGQVVQSGNFHPSPGGDHRMNRKRSMERTIDVGGGGQEDDGDGDGSADGRDTTDIDMPKVKRIHTAKNSDVIARQAAENDETPQEADVASRQHPGQGTQAAAPAAVALPPPPIKVGTSGGDRPVPKPVAVPKDRLGYGPVRQQDADYQRVVMLAQHHEVQAHIRAAEVANQEAYLVCGSCQRWIRTNKICFGYCSPLTCCDACCVPAREYCNHHHQCCVRHNPVWSPGLMSITAWIFALAIPLGQIAFQSGLEALLVPMGGLATVFTGVVIFWDYARREAGRRRLDPGAVVVLVVMLDAFAPALGEFLFFGLSNTRDSPIFQMAVISFVLGVLGLTQYAIDILAAASTVSPVASEPAKFLFGFLSRVFLAVAFVQLDPFSLAFGFTALVKMGRIIVVETRLYAHMWQAITQCNSRFVMWPVQPLWQAQATAKRVESAVLQEILATACVAASFLGEELMFAIGAIRARVLSASFDDIQDETDSLSGKMRSWYLDVGVQQDSLQSVLFGTGFFLIFIVTIAASVVGYIITRRHHAYARLRWGGKMALVMVRFVHQAHMRLATHAEAKDMRESARHIKQVRRDRSRSASRHSIASGPGGERVSAALPSGSASAGDAKGTPSRGEESEDAGAVVSMANLGEQRHRSKSSASHGSKHFLSGSVGRSSRSRAESMSQERQRSKRVLGSSQPRAHHGADYSA